MKSHSDPKLGMRLPRLSFARELPVWLQTVTIIALFGFCVVVWWAVGLKPYVQYDLVYSIDWAGLPATLIFFCWRFLRRQAYFNACANSRPGWHFVLVQLITVITSLVLCLGLIVVLGIFFGRQEVRD